MFRGSRHESTLHFCPRVKSLCSVWCSAVAGWLLALLHIERTIHTSPFCEVRALGSVIHTTQVRQNRRTDQNRLVMHVGLRLYCRVQKIAKRLQEKSPKKYPDAKNRTCSIFLNVLVKTTTLHLCKFQYKKKSQKNTLTL